MASSPTAHAYPEYVNTRYGLTALPASYSSYECVDCHVNAAGGGSPCGASTGADPFAPCFNAFGIAYRNSGWSATLRDQDHDGDGTDNGDELGAAGSAGFPAGAETPCDMLACATGYPSNTNCTGNIICNPARSNGPTSSGTNATGYHYSFTFQCRAGTGPTPSNADTNWSDRCLDINECSPNPCGPGTCTQRSLAGWTSPGYDCNCGSNPGYVDNGTTCQLVDACTAGTDLCVGVATCIDTAGSSAVYTCDCPNGYAGNGRSDGSGCTNIDECASDPCGPHDDGSGASGNGCTERALGSWTSPGYDCACAAGYGSNGTTCVLQDECTANTDDCHAVAACSDPTAAVGDFTCTCPSGYVGDGHTGGTGCTDVDECAMSLDDCDANATCGNTAGSFTCTCDSGFTGDGRTCSDVDECLDPVFSGMCDGNATCNNLFGTFECVCDAGYRGDGFSCVDIDECAESTDDCHAEATCGNTAGSFTCTCNAGYSGDGRTCADIDECLDPAMSGRCSSVATCNNLPGDWECVCNAGFRGDGFTCADIDECAEATDTCDANAACLNDNGSYSCLCNTGYRGSGFSCADIDECAEGTHGCTFNERCVNQVGMPNECVCAPGYARDDTSGECVVACGDGARAPGEECDDGNLATGDGCDDACAIEPGWACVEPTGGASTCTNTCGDGLIDATEECDDGAANDDAAANACRETCVLPACGDRVVDTGEECDSGPDNSDDAVDGCRTSCHLPYCGDGIVDSGERCDPGGGVPGAALAGTCTTMCAPDAGLDPTDPPELRGGACRVGSTGSAAPAWLLVMLALIGLARRRR